MENWIEISMIGIGILLSTCYFLRSSHLKKRNKKQLDYIEKNLVDGLYELAALHDELFRILQDIHVRCYDGTSRINIIETRLEEREKLLSPYLSSPQSIPQAPKRGRPPKQRNE